MLPSAFEVLGPVMVGPSSSHTAGALRLARVAREIAPGRVSSVEFTLYNSFAKTYLGHGTDKALAAGILGIQPDDMRLRDSLSLAREAGLSIRLEEVALEDAHPNTALITLTGRNGHTVSVQGASVGGGNILITRVNGMAVEITGKYPTLIVLHRDAPGTIAEVKEEISRRGVNI